MTLTPSDDPIRVGLLGFGLAGAAFHAPLIAATPGMKLTAVVTRDPERAEQVRARYPNTHVVDSAEALWDQADRLDLVVLATPNRTHVPLTLAAFDAGLAVVVDKPLAPTSDEGRRLIAEAERRGLLLTVFHNRRWDGDFLTLQRLLRDDALGDVQRFESRFEKWRPVPKPGWRQQAAPEEAGGLLFDLGAHLIDQALVLFGPVETVYAELDARRGAVDDDVFVALTHTSGVRSHLWMSAVAADLGPRMRVLGRRAAFTKYDLDVQEDRLRDGATPDQPGFSDEPEEQWGYIRSGDEAASVTTEPGDYAAFYAGVRDALRTGSPPPVDPEDAVRGLVLIEAARQSSETREVITL